MWWFCRPDYDSTSGYTQETIWFAGLPVATRIGGVLHIIRADHLGTPRSIARASDNVEVWRWDSEPFGKTPVAAGSTITYNLRFPGQYYEYQTGYHYNWMRDYDPQTGRYVQADPIRLRGGLSRYAYVGGNPLSFVDPDGLLFMATVGGAERGTTLDQAADYGGPGSTAAAVAGVTVGAAGIAVGVWSILPVGIVGGGLTGFTARSLLRGLRDDAMPGPTPPQPQMSTPPAIARPGGSPPRPTDSFICPK